MLFNTVRRRERQRGGDDASRLIVLRGRLMDWGWILLGVVVWGLCLLVVLVLMRMAGDQDRAARHAQKSLDPFTEITITRPGMD